MAGNMTLLTKIKVILQTVRNTVVNAGRFPPQHGMFGMPVVSFDYGLVNNTSAPVDRNTTPAETLNEIFGGILHFKVPRNRRSVERRLTRKHGEFFMKAARPKTNIITCLRCGKPHEVETLCGNCYSKVKEETEKLREEMLPHKDLINTKGKKVEFVYEGEDMEDVPYYKNGFVIEVPRERPSWFSPPLSQTNNKGNPENTS